MEHELHNKLAGLQLKAQLLSQVPIEQLNLRDKQEAVLIGFLAASLQATEAISKMEKTLAELNVEMKKSLYLRIRKWMSGKLSINC